MDQKTKQKIKDGSAVAASVAGVIATPLLVKEYFEYGHRQREELQQDFGPVISTLNRFVDSGSVRSADEIYSLRYNIANLEEHVSVPSERKDLGDAVINLPALAHDTAQGLSTNYQTTTALVEVRDHLNDIWRENMHVEYFGPATSVLLGAIVMISLVDYARQKLNKLRHLKKSQSN